MLSGIIPALGIPGIPAKSVWVTLESMPIFEAMLPSVLTTSAGFTTGVAFGGGGGAGFGFVWTTVPFASIGGEAAGSSACLSMQISGVDAGAALLEAANLADAGASSKRLGRVRCCFVSADGLLLLLRDRDRLRRALRHERPRDRDRLRLVRPPARWELDRDLLLPLLFRLRLRPALPPRDTDRA